MRKQNRELTGKEKRQIKKLVVSLCANYDKEYGCLPLDCDCYMFGICYTNSALCKRFREALLPADPELQAVFESHCLQSVSNAANRFRLTGNGCTARRTVPKKHAASRPLHGCVSTGKRIVRCNHFALEKSCAARFF